MVSNNYGARWIFCIGLVLPISCEVNERTQKEIKRNSSAQEINDNNQNEEENDQENANQNEDQNSDNQGNKQVQYKKPDNYKYPTNYNDSNQGGFAPKRHLLVWLEDPATEVIINWGIDNYSKGLGHKVYLSESPHYGKDLEKNYEIKKNAAESGVLKDCGEKELANIQAKIDNLKPNTTYFYVVQSKGQKSKEMHFVTAPESENVSFKILSGGDSRTDIDQRVIMNKMIAKIVKVDHNYLALVHGGDFINDGENCNEWTKWLDNHQHTIQDNGRILPLIPTFGNHEIDGEEIYEKLFGDPTGSQDFYFVSKIGRLSLLILNSEISTEGNQKSWLEKTLGSLAKKKDHHIIAGYHSPAWPAVKRPASTTAWLPIFDKYKLSLVLESDGHVLKQTCPIKMKQEDDYECGSIKEGVIYVGEGGLGVEQRTPKGGKWYFEGGYTKSQHHIQSIAIEKSKLTYEVYYNNKFNHKLEIPAKVRTP